MTIRMMTCCSTLASLLATAGCTSLHGAEARTGFVAATAAGDVAFAASQAGAEGVDDLAEPIDCFYAWNQREPECATH